MATDAAATMPHPQGEAPGPALARPAANHQVGTHGPSLTLLCDQREANRPRCGFPQCAGAEERRRNTPHDIDRLIGPAQRLAEPLSVGILGKVIRGLTITGDAVLIGIVGDRNPTNPTHRATDNALAQLGVDARWIPTPRLLEQPSLLAACDGALITPGSPYASMDGAIAAIRFAREQRMPVLGTCGGFQHMVVEFARNVAGLIGADHAEEYPEAHELVVVPLACSLAGQEHAVMVKPGTLAAELYGKLETVEPFFCTYGLNSAYRESLEEAGLLFSGFDSEGEPRILELPGQPFFVGTLYVPQASYRYAPHPLLAGLVTAAGQAAPA